MSKVLLVVGAGVEVGEVSEVEVGRRRVLSGMGRMLMARFWEPEKKGQLERKEADGSR